MTDQNKTPRHLRGWRRGETASAATARAMIARSLNIPAHDKPAIDGAISELVRWGWLLPTADGYMRPSEDPPKPEAVREPVETKQWIPERIAQRTFKMTDTDGLEWDVTLPVVLPEVGSPPDFVGMPRG